MTRVTAGYFVRPIVGETTAGDACLVAPWARGTVVALVDGLGHGPAAAAASAAFLACIEAGPDQPLPDLFASAHRTLYTMRGAVAVVARFDEGAGAVEIGGVGDVMVLLTAARSEPRLVLLTPGVLGRVFRSVHPRVLGFAPGDLLVMHTDGVRRRFPRIAVGYSSPEALARAIVVEQGDVTEDAACAVVVGTTSLLPVPGS